jgi:DNA-binding CsgD family transcriptional regulator/PAS domain-containing protein
MAKNGSDERDLLALIGRVYDAALDDTLWPALAPEIARTFGSISTALQLRNTRDGNVELLSLTDNLDLPLMADYRSHYWRHDQWANRAAELGMSRVFASKDLISDAALARTEYCQDWLRRLGVFYVVGSVFPIAEDEICVFGAHRARAQGTYEEDEKRPVAEFLPHLRRALQLRSRLAAPAMEKNAALDALERTETATIVVARDGRILYANRRAEALLRGCEAIGVAGGRIALADRAAAERLRFLIRDAAGTAAGSTGGAGGAFAIPRADRLPLTMLVAPFRAAKNGMGTLSPAAILFIRDPERPSLSTLALEGLFGLTPTEASIAAAIAEGKSPDEISAANGVSLNTVRTHLKKILAKTGTSRQAELVALLLRSVAALGSR